MFRSSEPIEPSFRGFSFISDGGPFLYIVKEKLKLQENSDS